MPDNDIPATGQIDERGSISRAARLLGALTMLSRVAGLLRDVAIGAVFGTGAGADAFFVAYRIPNLLRRVVAEGATSAAFVPVFTERLLSGGRESAVRAAASTGGAAVVVLALLTLAGMAASGPLITLFAPGFARDPAKQELTVALTRWCFPYLLLVGSAAWAMGVHHSFRNFVLPALGPVLMNVAIIAAALLLAPLMQTPAWALVIGVLAGGSVQVAVQLPALARLGFRPALFLAGDPAVRRCGRLMVAAVVGGSVYQVNVLIATVFASLLPAGTVAWLWYADRVLEFPLGIVAVAVGTAALPSLAAQASAARFDDMADTVLHALSLTIAFCLPAAVGLLLLSNEIASLLFERGSFTARDSEMTALALRAGVPGLVGVGLVRVLSSAFFALEKTRVPVLAGLFTLLLNALLAIALMGPAEAGPRWWGSEIFAALQKALGVADLRHAGLSLATGLSATANALVLLLVLRGMLPELRLRGLLLPLARHTAAALLMALAVAGWKSLSAGWDFAAGEALGLAAAIALGFGVYLAAALLLGSSEMRELFRRGAAEA